MHTALYTCTEYNLSASWCKSSWYGKQYSSFRKQFLDIYFAFWVTLIHIYRRKFITNLLKNNKNYQYSMCD